MTTQTRLERFERRTEWPLAAIAIASAQPGGGYRCLAARRRTYTIRGKVIAYTVCGAVVLVYAGSLAILQAERYQPGAKITGFGDAVWWAVTTVTTVGYGDLAPVTTMGRVVAVALMIGGITLVGTVTATLASWIVQRVAEEDTANEAATRAQIEELREEIRRLSNLVARDREPAYGEAREGF